MPIRQTSIQCYHQIEAEGIIGKQARLIYDFFKKNYPLTYNRIEISRYLNIKINAVTGRINELIKARWIEEISKSRDILTKRLCMDIRWRVAR